MKIAHRALIVAFLVGHSQVLALAGEIGPLEFSKEYQFVAGKNAKEQALRLESYGQMKLHLKFKGRGAILVEGPLAGAGDHTPVGSGPLVWRWSENDSDLAANRAEVNLALPGVYRVNVTPPSARYECSDRDLFLRQSLFLKVKCLQNCSRKSISASEFFSEYFSDGRNEAALKRAQEEINRLVPSVYSSAIQNDLARLIERKDFKALDHFPVIPLAAYSKLRAQFQEVSGVDHRGYFKAEAGATSNDPIVKGELVDLLGTCDIPRGQPVEIHPSLPELRYGHFPNLALTACQNAHSVKFAQILTALSVNSVSGNVPRSWVQYGKENYFSAGPLIKALLENGHEIELRQERTYANFLSMAVSRERGTEERDLLWPVWIDTGLIVKGQPLVIPAGHSQHVWKISGPTVNTTVSFFMGMFGAGFQSQTDTRPAWTGSRVSFSIKTQAPLLVHRQDYPGYKDAKKMILKTFEAAETYLHLNRQERATFAKNLPSDGYGYLGICNDSDAFLEMSSRQTCGAYPLVRSGQLNLNLGSTLNQVLRRLPDDASLDPSDEKDALRRIYNMRPYELGSQFWIDPVLRDQMLELSLRFGN